MKLSRRYRIYDYLEEDIETIDDAANLLEELIRIKYLK